jgi:hypothetical protein
MVGHIPDAVSASEVARAGQASVEHPDGVLLACSRQEAAVRWLARQNRSPWKLALDTFDAAKADALIDSFRSGALADADLDDPSGRAPRAGAPAARRRSHPARALRAAPSNPAEFLKVGRDYGSIEAGKIADLVILDANPLDAIGNTRRIRTVVRRGRAFDRAALDGMLDRVRRAVAGN